MACFVFLFLLFIKASFIVDTKGWYCVFFFLAAGVLGARTSCFCGFYLFLIAIFLSNCVAQMLLRLKASPLTNQWVTRGEMCVLEGFRLFKMCLYIKDGFFVDSCAFVYNCV